MIKMSELKNQDAVDKEVKEIDNLTKITPRFSAWTEEDKIIIRVVIPGVDRKDIEMKALQDRFLLRARRDEIMYDLDLALDIDIEPNTAKAEYKEGLLRAEFKRLNPLDHAYEVPIE
jgi:HSP20 family molecular chaperone IbpA